DSVRGDRHRAGVDQRRGQLRVGVYQHRHERMGLLHFRVRGSEPAAKAGCRIHPDEGKVTPLLTGFGKCDPKRKGDGTMTYPQPGTWAADAAHFARPTRRDLIRVGWLGALGLSLGSFLKLEAVRAADPARKIEPRAKAVIHVYLQGGFAHMDSFDPKPDAPAE